MLSKLIFIFAFAIIFVHTKVYSNRFSLTDLRRHKGWLFLDRMSFDRGQASVKITVKIQTPTEGQRQIIPIQLAVIPQNMWLEQQFIQCTKIKQNGDTIIIPIEIKKSQQYQGSVLQQLTITQHTNFHFVLKDCSKIITSQNFRKQTKINVILQMINGQYSHGSDQHANKFVLPILLILTGVMGYFSKGPKHNDVGQQRDWAKLLLFITLAFNFIALFFNYIGFISYLASGQHYGFFDFMYLLFHSISESVLTSIILFIAYGWTITFTKDAQFDLYVPLVAMLGLINLILTLLGKINDGEADKYHMYDTIPSYLLVFFRVVTIIIFAIGVIKVYIEQKKNSNLVSFLANFALMGSIYFLSLPAIMIIASMLPVSSRKQIVFFSVQCIKNIVNLLLTWMVSSKKSKYKNIKQSGQSFFQTGNKLL